MNQLRTAIFALICIALLSQCAGAQLKQPTGIVDGEIGAKLDEQMRRRVENGFSGVLFIAKSGRVLLDKGYGEANKANHIPYTADTVFDIGSITKQFTGAAILKLEMQGKLRTTDPISKYLAGAPAEKAAITLHQLLTHSAGLVESLGPDYEAVSRDEYIRMAFASKLESVPGEAYHYSNVGYSLLGAVIEIVSGKSYERYLHDNLFIPAGMNDTGCVIPKWRRDKVATGYQTDGSVWGTPLDKAWAADGPYWHLRANGGLLSTVGDLYKWHLALAGEKVLSKQAKEKYYAPHIAEQPERISFYGYGWVTQKTRRGTSLIWHNGSNRIFAAEFRRYMDEDVVVIGASNVAGYTVGKELPQLMSMIFEVPKTSGGGQ